MLVHLVQYLQIVIDLLKHEFHLKTVWLIELTVFQEVAISARVAQCLNSSTFLGFFGHDNSL